MADPGTDLVAALLASPGVHVGLGRSEDTAEPYVARIVVAPLPGLGGVALDFEAHSAFRLATGDAYFEHAMLGRQRDGSTVLVTAHSPGATLTVMAEVEPGRFVSPSAEAPSVGVRVEVPEPGTITYAWSWALPGDGFRERDVATATRIVPTPGR
jgi:hypothetical protein